MQNLICLRLMTGLTDSIKPARAVYFSGGPESAGEQAAPKAETGPELQARLEAQYEAAMKELEAAAATGKPEDLVAALDNAKASATQAADLDKGDAVKDYGARFQQLAASLGLPPAEIARLAAEFQSDPAFTRIEVSDNFGPDWVTGSSEVQVDKMGEELAAANDAQRESIKGDLKASSRTQVETDFRPRIEAAQGLVSTAEQGVTASAQAGIDTGIALGSATTELQTAQAAIDDKAVRYNMPFGYEMLLGGLGGKDSLDYKWLASAVEEGLIAEHKDNPNWADDQGSESLTRQVGRRIDTMKTLAQELGAKRSAAFEAESDSEAAKEQLAIWEGTLKDANEAASDLAKEHDATLATVENGTYVVDENGTTIEAAATELAKAESAGEAAIKERYQAAAEQRMEELLKRAVVSVLEGQYKSLEANHEASKAAVASRVKELGTVRDEKRGDAMAKLEAYGVKNSGSLVGSKGETEIRSAISAAVPLAYDAEALADIAAGSGYSGKKPEEQGLKLVVDNRYTSYSKLEENYMAAQIAIRADADLAGLRATETTYEQQMDAVRAQIDRIS